MRKYLESINRKTLLVILIASAFVLTISVVYAALTLNSTTAALTFNSTTVSSDGALTLTGNANSTLDLGASHTLSLQTTNNGPITTGSGLFTLGGNLTIPNGKVGIGTTTPNASLVISAAGSVPLLSLAETGGSSISASIIQTLSDTGAAVSQFGYQRNAEAFKIQTTGTMDNTGFSTSNDFVINSFGNVGIGTTNPTAKLFVKGDTEIHLENDAGTYSSNLGQSGSSGGYLYLNGSVGTVMLRTYGVSYFNGGNVGIGTTEPGAKLEVSSTNSNSVFEALRLTSNSNYMPGRGVEMSFYPPNLIDSSHLGGEIIVSNNLTDAGNNDMSFTTGGLSAPTEKMRIMASGNVGIGTTSVRAGSKLEVAGIIQTDAQSTDPGCTATADIGKFWFDNTTTTTAVKVCKSVSGVVGWSTVTTTS